MAITHEVTPFYIRTADGDTYYVETLEEALQIFTSDDGYRLTLSAGGNEIVIRRGGWLAEHPMLHQREAGATLVWRKGK